jgi:hypothetical protein
MATEGGIARYGTTRSGRKYRKVPGGSRKVVVKERKELRRLECLEKWWMTEYETEGGATLRSSVFQFGDDCGQGDGQGGYGYGVLALDEMDRAAADRWDGGSDRWGGGAAPRRAEQRGENGDDGESGRGGRNGRDARWHAHKRPQPERSSDEEDDEEGAGWGDDGGDGPWEPDEGELRGIVRDFERIRALRAGETVEPEEEEPTETVLPSPDEDDLWGGGVQY